MNRTRLRLASIAAHGFRAVLALATLALLTNREAAADPAVGFVEHFTAGGDLRGWTSSAVNTNPGTGGVGGVGDGYLHTSRPSFAASLGAHSTFTEYNGDWLAANADRVRFSLNDVGANQVLEVHFGLGNPSNFWQYNVGFIPPDGAWAEFTVDLTDSTAFTHIIDFGGTTTWSGALRTVDRVLIRHDFAPYAQGPDPILGEFGIDEFKIEASLVGVEGRAIARGRPVMLAPPSPNPSRGGTRLAFESFDDGEVTLSIVDARGRLVVREVLPAAPAGARSWSWDGRDQAGRDVAAGVYRVRAYGKAGGMSRPLVRIN